MGGCNLPPPLKLLQLGHCKKNLLHFVGWEIQLAFLLFVVFFFCFWNFKGCAKSGWRKHNQFIGLHTRERLWANNVFFIWFHIWRMFTKCYCELCVHNWGISWNFSLFEVLLVQTSVGARILFWKNPLWI